MNCFEAADSSINVSRVGSQCLYFEKVTKKEQRGFKHLCQSKMSLKKSHVLFLYTFLISPACSSVMLCVFVCVRDRRRGYGNGSRGGREGLDGPAMKSA